MDYKDLYENDERMIADLKKLLYVKEQQLADYRKFNDEMRTTLQEEIGLSMPNFISIGDAELVEGEIV